MTVRAARPADLAAVVAVYNESIPGRLATADTEAVSVEDRRAWFEAHTEARRPLWVDERERAIAGWCSLSDFYGRPAYGATAEISVYVSSAAQRAGVARGLVAHALDAAPALGLETILAFVFDHNEPSLRLFAGFGFESWGHLPRTARLDDLEVGVRILGRRLVD